MVEERRLPEAGGLGDLAHADAGEAAAREQVLRGVEDPVPRANLDDCCFPHTTDRSVYNYRSIGRLSIEIMTLIMFGAW